MLCYKNITNISKNFQILLDKTKNVLYNGFCNVFVTYWKQIRKLGNFCYNTYLSFLKNKKGKVFFMRNIKHSTAAIMAVAMLCTLAKIQGEDIAATKKLTEQRINTAAAHESITITEKQIDDSVMGVALETSQQDAQIVQTELEETAAPKSSYRIAYVKLTSGTLNLREQPSENATVKGQLNAVDQVEILESTDGYFKVASQAGTGYVSSACITADKEEAQEAAKHYENYRVAEITASSVNVRKSASTQAEALTGLERGTKIVVLYGEGDFIKIAYGSDYDEGYVINTSIDFNGDWIKKSEVKNTQQAAAQRREAAAQAEARARAAAAAGGYNATDATSSQTSAAASSITGSSSKGQALVNTAKQYMGVPYVWGGTSPRGFDCSGLVQYVCRQNGISVNRVAADQRKNGVYVSRENLQPGDLVFFAKGGRIHHVGIYVGNGNMIHAPQTGDVVKISSIESSYRVRTYAGAVRVY